MLIDTHAHLFYPNFADDLDEVIERSDEAGVDFILVPGTDIKTSREAVELAERYDKIFAAIGVHPHDTKDWKEEWLKELDELTHSVKVVGIGEIGLDYYYDFSPKDIQNTAFRKQIDFALDKNLPIVVHNRESNNDMMTTIRSYDGKNLRAQFHCFAGSAEDAKELVELGHLISFPGNITFKKQDSLRQIVSTIPIQKLMIETDSPFMTPVPHRGKRNEPMQVKLVAEQLAEIHNLSFEEAARITSENAMNFFNLVKR